MKALEWIKLKYMQHYCSHRRVPKLNHGRNFKSTTKARETEGTNIKSFTDNSFISS